jgi:hypothetical protein
MLGGAYRLDRDLDTHGQFGFERSPTHPLHLILLVKDLRATLGDLGYQ